MPSVVELYNQEVLDGHREAVAALRDLLATEKDPHERRKLANALLRARTVKVASTEEKPEPSPRSSQSEAQPKLGAAHASAAFAHLAGLMTMLNRDEADDNELDDVIDDEIDESS